MSVDLPERLNIAERFLTGQLAEHGDSIAVIAEGQRFTYRQVDELASRFANVLASLGVEPEQRVVIGLPDGIHFVAALFGALKLGAVGVMVNRDLGVEQLRYFFDYTRCKVAVFDTENADAFLQADAGARDARSLLSVGEGRHEGVTRFEDVSVGNTCDIYATHRDDPALWLFSGGTTGFPKAVVQTHRSFANTTVLYGQRVLGLSSADRTLSVPKLYFGYATGSNLFFPFSVGGSTILFRERCTADKLYELIAAERPTLLINVPTMIGKLLAHDRAETADLSTLRISTSAGEALPPELHARWMERFGVELLDGLGTAEMWHVFVSNKPGEVKPGSLGKVVPGFEVRVCDDQGNELPRGEAGWLWVRGDSRATCYWQQHEKSMNAFRGEWYVSGDMIRMDEQGWVYYCGRGDDMLKVSGKWLAPAEVENCLLQHDAVKECAVIGVVDGQGLTKPHAFILVENAGQAADVGLEGALRQHVSERLEPYKTPRQVHLKTELPRTHLGKIDRGALRRLASES